MGKYMRQQKAAKSGGDVAVMEGPQPYLGVRTRAKTLALQRSDTAYLQLRSRRLIKPPIAPPRSCQSKRQKCPPPSAQGSPNSEGKNGKVEEREERGEGYDVVEEADGEKEASFGENVLEFEGRDRSTRESTPCSLIRDPEIIRTPGSSTRPAACSALAHQRAHNPVLSQIPTGHDMDAFFAGAQELEHKQFMEKYNFDPVNEVPLPGRYEWVKVNPKA